MAKAPARPVAQSKTRERATAARKAVAAGRTQGGAPAAAATYVRARHQQKKARRTVQKDATERARVASEQRQVQQKATRKAGGGDVSLPKAISRFPRKALLAELVVCLVVVWAGALVAPQGENNGTTRAMVKTSGLAGLFLILALLSTAGKGAQRTAAGFGFLVTIAYVFTSGDALAVVRWASRFWSKEGVGGAGGDVGGAIGEAGGQVLGGGVVAGALLPPEVRAMQT